MEGIPSILPKWEDRRNECWEIREKREDRRRYFRLSCQNGMIDGMSAVRSSEKGEVGGSISAISAKRGRLMAIFQPNYIVSHL